MTTALFERALGDGWTDLHPRIRNRYGVVAADGQTVVADGTMRTLQSSYLAFPVLWVGTVDDFLFPARDEDVPFRMTTETFVDGAGNEALFLEREFDTDPTRTFVDTLRWNPERECITDLFGHRGHVAADLTLGVDGDALTLSIGQQWLRVAGRYVPLPGPLGVDGTLRDWYDEADGRFRVEADITSPLIGSVFTYSGSFENEVRDRVDSSGTPSRLSATDLPGGPS